MSKQKKTYKVYLAKGRGVLINREHTEGLVVTEDKFFANSLVYSRKIGSFEPFPNQNPDGTYTSGATKKPAIKTSSGSPTGQGKSDKEPK